MTRHRLAIDTSGSKSYFALCDLAGASPVRYSVGTGQLRAEGTIREIDQLLRGSSDGATDVVRLEEISEVIVATGPGSFTGVRSGIATALGIAGAINAECRGLNTLFSRVVEQLKYDGLFVPIMPANARELFFSAYEVRDGGKHIVERLAPSLGEGQSLQERLVCGISGFDVASLTIVDVSLEPGGGAKLLPEELMRLISFKEVKHQHAGVLLNSAATLAHQHSSLAGLFSLEPRYIKGVNARTLVERGLA